MITNNKLQMAKLAYENNNFEEAYKLSSGLVIESQTPDISAESWILKGLSAGCLS
mgnify:CR=1 FL=1